MKQAFVTQKLLKHAGACIVHTALTAASIILLQFYATFVIHRSRLACSVDSAGVASLTRTCDN